MRIIYFLVILLCFTNIGYSQDWISTSIEDLIEIDFPSKVDVNEIGGRKIYSYQTDEDFFIVTMVGLGRTVPDSKLPEVYEGVIDGGVEASDGILISKEPISIGGQMAVQYRVKAAGNSQLPNDKFYRTIYLEGTLIIAQFMTFDSDEGSSKSKMNNFFGSIKIKRDTISIDNNSLDNVENNSSQNTYEVAYLVGKIAFFIVLVFCLIGVFLVVRYFLRKKSINQPIEETKTTKKNLDTIQSVCKNCDAVNSTEAKYCAKCGFQL